MRLISVMAIHLCTNRTGTWQWNDFESTCTPTVISGQQLTSGISFRQNMRQSGLYATDPLHVQCGMTVSRMYISSRAVSLTDDDQGRPRIMALEFIGIADL